MAEVEVPGCSLGKVLGQGGFATVYRGERGGASVAIKVALAAGKAAAAGLERERKLLERVGAAAAPAVLDGGVLPDGRGYLVMELIPWPTLKAYRTDRTGQLPFDEVIAVGRAVAAAVGAVHAAGLVHRDLKPDNIMIGTPLAVKLLDFGIARTAGQEEAEAPADAGTAAYMSPEQCESSAWIGPESDVYALGVILHELASGSTPFVADSASELMQAHIARRPPRLAGPRALSRLVRRCLAKEPDDRFADAGALAEALGELGRELVASDAVEAEGTPAPGPASAAAREAAAREAGAAREPAAAAREAGAAREPAAAAREAGAAREPAAAARETRRMAIVYLAAGQAIDLGQLGGLMTPFGGQLAQVVERRAVLVFDPDRGKTPMDRAIAAAESITATLRASAALDFGPVELRKRGKRTRYGGAGFDAAESYPEGRRPGEVLLTARAASAGQIASAPVAGTPWHRAIAVDGDLTSAEATRAGPGAGDESMIGHGEVLDGLVASARAAAARGAPGVALLVGDAGLGKSHACAALLRRMVREFAGRVMLVVAPEPLAGGDTSGALRRLVTSALELREVRADGARAAVAALLGAEAGAAGWPIIGHALGLVESDDPTIRRLAATPGAFHDALVTGIGGLVREQARRGPLAVVLDDAQYADGATLDALEYAALAEAGLPLWIGTFARPVFEENRPQWGERAAARHQARLGPLSVPDAATLCRRLLLPADEIPEAAILAIVGRGGGVPLLLVELVRGLKAGGLVRPKPAGGGWYVATDEIDASPDTPLVDWLAERRLAKLEPALARYCQLLSLLGIDFDRSEVDDVIEQLGPADVDGVAALDAGVAIRRLVREEILGQSSGGKVLFRHGMFREAIERSASDGLRQRVHAAALEVHRGRAAVDDAALLKRAFHADRCGVAAEAAGLYLALGDRHAFRHAYLEAEKMYSSGLALLGDDPSQIVAGRRGRGMMRYRLGRYGDTVGDFEVAIEQCRAVGDTTGEAHALLDLATALDWMAHYARSAERVEEARALVERHHAGDALLAAKVSLGIGRSLFRASDLKPAIAALMATIERVEPCGDEGYETLVVAHLLASLMLPVLGDLVQSGAVVDRMIALCEEHGDRMHLAGALTNRRVLAIAHKDLPQIVVDGLRCLTIARELALTELEFIAAYNLAELLYLHGEPADLEQARPLLVRALEIERRRPEFATRPLASLLELRIQTFVGDAAAEATLAAIAAQQARAAAAGKDDALFAPHERAMFDMVRLTFADPHDEVAWRELQDHIGKHAMEQEAIEVAEFEVRALQRRGRVAEARAGLGLVVERLATTPSVMDDRIARLQRALEG